MLNIFNFKGKNQKKSQQQAKSDTKAKRNFAAVRIVYSSNSGCDAVKSQSGTIYLRSESPLIPLSLCTNRHYCECKYEHFRDRRHELRRETDFGLPDRFSGRNRRNRTDRRAS